MITPNLAELREVVGRWKDEEDLEARARKALREKLGLEALLLTRGEDGMTLFRDEAASSSPGAGARGVRRHRRRRHGDRDARGDARRGRGL